MNAWMTFVVSSLLVAAVPIALVAGLHHRNVMRKGIGKRFVGFASMTTVVPVIGLLALNNALSDYAASLLCAWGGISVFMTFMSDN